MSDLIQEVVHPTTYLQVKNRRTVFKFARMRDPCTWTSVFLLLLCLVECFTAYLIDVSRPHRQDWKTCHDAKWNDQVYLDGKQRAIGDLNDH